MNLKEFCGKCPSHRSDEYCNAHRAHCEAEGCPTWYLFNLLQPAAKQKAENPLSKCGKENNPPEEEGTMPEIAKCPWCNHDKTFTRLESGYFVTGCSRCGAHGPEHETMALAEEDWQAVAGKQKQEQAKTFLASCDEIKPGTKEAFEAANADLLSEAADRVKYNMELEAQVRGLEVKLAASRPPQRECDTCLYTRLSSGNAPCQQCDNGYSEWRPRP